METARLALWREGLKRRSLDALGRVVTVEGPGGSVSSQQMSQAPEAAISRPECGHGVIRDVHVCARLHGQ